MSNGWYLTRKGWNLLVKVGAGTASLNLSRVLVGSGTVADNIDLQSMTALVSPKASATSTMPVVSGTTVSMTVEYRNDLNGGLSEGFGITELGIYAVDPDEGEVLLFYGQTSEQWVDAYDADLNIVEVRRFPITMTFDTATGVTVCYPVSAWMTADDVMEYCTATALPVFMESVDEAIAEHNTDTSAHTDIRKLITSLTVTEQLRWASLVANVSGESYSEDFSTLDGLSVTGIWNETEGRIEF